eukprot:gene10648-13045_t
MKRLSIGLLKCDSFIPEIKSKFGDIDVQFKNLLNCNTLQTTVDLNVFECVQNKFPIKDDIMKGRYNGFIITGSRSSVNDDTEWTHTLQDYIRLFNQNNIKTVGICYGHQSIAKALGGEVTTNSKGWQVSDHTFKVNQGLLNSKYQSLFNNGSGGGGLLDLQSLNIICLNKQIVSKLPTQTQLDVFGSNESSDNQAAINSNFLSFQGHPEFTPEVIKALILSRRGIIPDDVIDDGVKRADNSKIDQSVYANAIISFITSK